MTTLDIPTEWQELSERKSAEIAGVSRSTFRRKHIDEGCPKPISQREKQNGDKYIPFEEVYRLYGEAATNNLKKILNGPDEPRSKNGPEQNEPDHKPVNQLLNHKENPFLSIHFEEYLTLRESLAERNTEVKHLEQQLEAEKKRADAAEQREGEIFQQLKRSQMLLEDKRKKEEPKPGLFQKWFGWGRGSNNNQNTDAYKSTERDKKSFGSSTT